MYFNIPGFEPIIATGGVVARGPGSSLAILPTISTLKKSSDEIADNF